MGKILIDIARAFLFLGLTSFGGPAVHIARFEQTFVRKLGWLSAQQYQMLVAQAHFLPGPASSQVGFAIGFLRAGFAGAIIAFVAFTLPSVLLMLAMALQLLLLVTPEQLDVILAAMKLFAVVVVADAVRSMAASFCNDWFTRVVALLATGLVLLAGLTPWVLIAGAGVAGLARALVLKAGNTASLPGPAAPSIECPTEPLAINQVLLWLALWLLILVASFLLPSALWSGFYQAGSFVFGGGHVVLPMLAETLAGRLDSETLLTGYAAAQMVPGPMFTMVTWLAAIMQPEAPFSAALVATLAIFLPGFLLMLAVLPFWRWLSQQAQATAAVAAVNAAVVGLLLATLLGPVVTGAIYGVTDVLLVLLGLVLMMWRKVSVLLLMGFVLVAKGALVTLA
ncbi:chromate efflux transporter [Thalassolituus marinus]|uniref:Chromate efflux transporter n=1 Tax=Thalassolituus marinus TaxID=671053 RepID=A0ABS7ZVG4_9GAMM|nr:chromate efflux transporter [Thalassolituus marinus]MCA6065208.1 chromate efflux transporter [Thalassolituus marinus]